MLPTSSGKMRRKILGALTTFAFVMGGVLVPGSAAQAAPAVGSIQAAPALRLTTEPAAAKVQIVGHAMVINPDAVEAAEKYLATGTRITAPAAGHTTAAQRQALALQYAATDYPLYWKTVVYSNSVDGKYPVKNQRIKLVSTWVLDGPLFERLYLSDSFQQIKHLGIWGVDHLADRVECRFYVDGKSKDGSGVKTVGDHIVEIRWSPANLDYSSTFKFESWVNYRMLKTHVVKHKKVRYYIKAVGKD